MLQLGSALRPDIRGSNEGSNLIAARLMLPADASRLGHVRG
jgi:hypothetical protein